MFRFAFISIFLIFAAAAYPHTNGEVQNLLVSQAENPIEIVIVGDGYTMGDLIDGGLFETDAGNMTDKFFSVSPFREYRVYFNVHVVYVASKQSGADVSPDKDTRNTAFDSTFNSYDIDRLLTVQDAPKVRRSAAKACENPQIIIVLVNSTNYGGSGGEFTVVSKNKQAFLMMLHELGHSFSDLGDEYVDAEAAKVYSSFGVDAKPNLETTSDRDEVKWKRYFDIPGYEAVGVYEGGNYVSKGVWRPQKTCIMRDIYYTYTYCHICREAIARTICEHIGKDFSFEGFLKRNPVNIEKDWNTDASVLKNCYGETVIPETLDDFSNVESAESDPDYSDADVIDDTEIPDETGTQEGAADPFEYYRIEQ